jgi:hypothetical protein
MASTTPSKDIDQQTDLKRKTQQFVVYMQLNLQMNKNIA